MDWIVWDEQLRTECPSMDEDHQKLADLINQLADGVTYRKGNDWCIT